MEQFPMTSADLARELGQGDRQGIERVRAFLRENGCPKGDGRYRPRWLVGREEYERALAAKQSGALR